MLLKITGWEWKFESHLKTQITDQKLSDTTLGLKPPI
jgi:hypothetical protein